MWSQIRKVTLECTRQVCAIILLAKNAPYRNYLTKISIVIIIWPKNTSRGENLWTTTYEMNCITKEDEPMTNVTWDCDQESGKLSCRNSLTFCNMMIEEDDRVTNLKSDLGLQQTGVCNHFCFYCSLQKIPHITKSLFSAESVKHQIQVVQWESLQSEAAKIALKYLQMLPLILFLYFCHV